MVDIDTSTFQSYPNPGHNNSAQPSLSLFENEQMLSGLGLSGFLDFDGADFAKADGTGRWITIPAGRSATIRGTVFDALADVRVPISPNPSNQTRLDLAVLRLRRTVSAPGANDAYTITPYVIEGVPAAQPVEPVYVQSLETTGVFDLPFGRVTASPGSGAILAGNFLRRGWWTTGGSYICKAGSQPPVEPGVALWEADTGIYYVGTLQNVWLKHYYFLGPVHFNTPDNWSITQWGFVRDGNLVTMSMALKRTGAAVPKNESVTFGKLGENIRPPETWWGTYYCSAPNHSGYVGVTPGGDIVIAADYENVIAQNSTIFCNMTWPTKP